MKRYMITVAFALIPCLLFGMFNAGYQHNLAAGMVGLRAHFWSHLWEGVKIVLPILIVSYGVGGFWEVLFATVRKHEISEGFLISGLLFPLTLPPSIPLWQVAAGISFGVVIGKEIFGGVGFNILNPALAARCFLYFAYPGQISGDGVWTHLPARVADGWSGATALSVAKGAPAGVPVVDTLASAGHTLKSMAIGLEPGSIGETSVPMILLGAGLLLLTGVAAWRIMAGGVLGMVCLHGLVGFLPPAVLQAHPMLTVPWYYELAMGGALFGIVFMATDPVSAAATDTGKWIYGFMIGALTVMVRLFNPAYPEGNMLAILFMNVMAPMVDYFVVQAHIRRRRRYLESFPHA
jgi:Na+-transporting NADH:ubiquinone oxidoreductase subunit B